MNPLWLIIPLAILVLVLVFLVVYIYRLRSQHLLALEGLEEELSEEYEEDKKLAIERALAGQKSKVFGDDIAKLVPFYPDYPYNLRDVVPIFNTCDYIVLVGKVGGRITEVVFQEMKSSAKAPLVREQPSLRQCIQQKKVRWETWRLDQEKSQWVCTDLP